MSYTEPLPYHKAMVGHLREHLPSAWTHYASDLYQAQHEDAIRLHLLQTTYQLQPESHPEPHAIVAEVAAALGLSVTVELYQGEVAERMGAAMFFHPTTARLVFHGPILSKLDPQEQRALIAHELAHHLLWIADGGDYLNAFRVLVGLSSIEEHSALQSMQLFQLHTEVFCDRAALTSVGEEAAIGALLKVKTDIDKPVAADFIAQSEELLAKQGTGSREWSHPEAHLRALALHRFATDANSDVLSLLEGPLALEDLDLVRRQEFHEATRSFVGHILQPAWLRTTTVMGHTSILLDDDLPAFEAWNIDPESYTKNWGPTLADYFVALLLDFTAVDPSLGHLPLCRCHQVAEWLGITKAFEKGVNKKLKLRRKDITAALEGRDAKLADADAEGGEE